MLQRISFGQFLKILLGTLLCYANLVLLIGFGG